MHRFRKKGKPSEDKEEAQLDELKFSKAEEEIFLNIFQKLLTQAPEVLLNLEKVVGSNEHDEMCGVLLNIALQNGSAIQICKLFIEDEFKKYAKEDPGSIMRGNCVASKLTKVYLQKIGRNYINSIVGKSLNEILDSNQSWEIDPSKIDPNSIEQHKQLLLDKVKNVIQVITSPNAIDSMPDEIKIIASFIGQMSETYAQEQFSALVGGFLFLRYINPSFITPTAYGLIPESKQMSSVARRNLVLLTKILQNLSNSVEFQGKKESFMVVVNDWLRANMWKMEKYFQSVVSKAPSVPPKVIDPNASSVSDFKYFQTLLTETPKIFEPIENNSALVNDIVEQLDKLKQFHHIDKFTERKYSSDQNATITITIQTKDQQYEETLDSTVINLQPLVSQLLSKIKKQDLKIQKKRETQKFSKPGFFGKPLEEIMEVQKITKPELKIPEIIQDALAIILLKGLATSGIFLQQVDKGVLDSLKKQADLGEKVSFSKIEDMHIVAAFILLYFKELPIFVTEKFYDICVDAKSDVSKLKTGLNQLPSVLHKELLHHLLRVFFQVAQNAPSNSVTSKQLALTIAPIFVPKGKPKPVDSLILPIETMIEQYELLFKELIASEDQQLLAQGPVWKQRIVAHNKSIQKIVLTGDLVVSSSADGIKLWSSHDASFKGDIPLNPNYGKILTILAVSNGDIWCSTEKVIYIWGTKQKAAKAVIEKGSSSLTQVFQFVWANSLTQNIIQLFTCDGVLVGNFNVSSETAPSIPHLEYIKKTVWGGGFEGTIYVWDAETRTPLKTIPKAHKKKITAFAELDGNVWSGSDDGSVFVWQMSTFQNIKKIDTHSTKVKSLASWNGQMWLGSWEMLIKVYASNTSLIHDLKEQHTDAINGILFIYNYSRQKWYAWSCSYDQSISIWLLPDAPPPVEESPNLTLSSSSNRNPHDYGEIPFQRDSIPIVNIPVTSLPSSPTLNRLPQTSNRSSPKSQRPPVTQQHWLYGNLDRGSAESLLASPGQGNYFLIRASSIPNCYALSKVSNNQAWHMVIQPVQGGYSIQDSTDKNVFPTLDILVQKSSELTGFIPIGQVIKK